MVSRARLVIVMVTSSLAFSGCKHIARAVAFEGEIEMQTAMTPGTVLTIVYETKGDKVRIETKGLPSYAFITITDMDAKKSWTLDDASRSYSEVDLEALSAPAAKKPSTPPPTLKKTGRTDRIAGYACDVYMVDTGGTFPTHAETCLAPNLGLSLGPFGIANPFAAFARESNDSWSTVFSKGFPLRTVVLDASGKPTMKLEATRVEKKSLPDSLFAIPPGYVKKAI